MGSNVDIQSSSSTDPDPAAGAAGPDELKRPTGRLDQRAWALLRCMKMVGWPDLSELQLDWARCDLRTLIAATSIWQPVARVRDALVSAPGGDVPVRVYTPLTGAAPRPLLVWCHGGGFVLGDLTTADPTCRALANRAGAVVISVDYRLAPEHSLLDALADAHAAAMWGMEHAPELGCDPARIAVGGDSAGATLSALVAQRCRDVGEPMPALQVLVYPCTDLSGTVANRDPDVARFLTWDTVDWFGEHCFGGLDPADPQISPYFAKELTGLPPALIITAECDLLCTDGEAYGKRLREAGVPVELHRYAGQIHGFFMMDLLFPAARQAQRRVASRLRAMAVQTNPAPAHRRASTSVAWSSSRPQFAALLQECLRRSPPVLAAQMTATLLRHRVDRFSRRRNNDATDGHSRKTAGIGRSA